MSIKLSGTRPVSSLSFQSRTGVPQNKKKIINVLFGLQLFSVLFPGVTKVSMFQSKDSSFTYTEFTVVFSLNLDINPSRTILNLPYTLT